MVDPVLNGSVSKAQNLRVDRATGQPAGLRQKATEAGTLVATPVLTRMVGELVQQGPPIDFARIAQLRQAIAEGSYDVDPRAIARAMIGFAKSD
jgi:negative regulator of flagellin synthesis FlgM